MKPILLSMLVLTSLVAFPVLAQQSDPSTQELLKRISADLPKGWTASHDPRTSVLEVSRKETVPAVSAQPNANPSEEPTPSHYSFAFRTAPALSSSEYRELAAQDQKTGEEMQKAYEALVKKRVAQKFDSFRPANDEEKALVARYESLKNSLQPLPSYYFRDVSLSWVYGSPQKPLIRVMDATIRAECEAVQTKVLSLLSTYKKGS